MAKKRFLTREREKWLARTFQGLFLIACASAASEAFVKYPLAGRGTLVAVVAVSFFVGLYFARAELTERKEE
jgi:hypothetical protein